MSRSYTRVVIHAVIVTKHRIPVLTQELLDYLEIFISRKFSQKAFGELMAAGGYFDHIHLLFRQNPQVSLSKVLQITKGSSSRFLNKIGTQDELHFSWQRGYYANSVSQSSIPKIIEYINQQQHHHYERGLESEFDMHGW